MEENMKKEKKNSQTKDYQVSRLKVELLYQIKNMIVLFKLSCTTESKTQVNTITHLKQGKHHKKPLGVSHTSTKEGNLQKESTFLLSWRKPCQQYSSCRCSFKILHALKGIYAVVSNPMTEEQVYQGEVPERKSTKSNSWCYF